ncbi:MAG: hypothetical protein H6667_24055 [Ardenticatenaceae bacterium]|nr:hypothetical protein [Ardenticatenaceae bacterium]
MEPFYVFIILNDVWILFLCVAGLFWFGKEFLRSRQILRRAMFGLERERGTRLRNNSLAFIILFATIIGIVYYVDAQVRPTLPEALFKPPTPTPDIFATRLSSPTPLSTSDVLPPSPTAELVPTITLPSQPGQAPPAAATGEIESTAVPLTPPTPSGPTVTPFIGCNVDLNISEPRNGAAVSGSITFYGTADFDDFFSYELSTNGPQTNGEWASLLGRAIEQPVRDGLLGTVNLSQWTSGPYLIRLTAVNTTQSPIGQCVIQVTLSN